MKKNFFLVLLLTAICGIAAAQTVTITGNVKDINGNLLHYAFVRDLHFKGGAYTDSLGNFTLEINANGALAVNCAGYKDTVVDASGNAPVLVIMHPLAVNDAGGSANGQSTNSSVLQATLRDQINLTTSTVIQQGSAIPTIHIKEATQGSRTFFKNWVHGYIVNSGDSLVQNAGFLLNYDKISGSLLLTKDKISTIAIYKDKINSFTLVDNINQPYTFTLVPAIDKNHYVQVLAAGNNYKIYKLTTTKFIASNYSTDGLATTGNDYDEYADDNTYYVIGKSGAPQKLSLKKKALKEVFNGDQAKLNQYMLANDGDIDDNYLRGLGDYMNK